MGYLKKGLRTLAEAAALCLLLTALPAPAQAQEQQTGQDSQTVLTTKVDGYPDTVEKGSGEVTLDDGTVLTVEGEGLPDGLLFVVEQTLEKENRETYDWIETCMEGLGTNLRVYDIYFVDSNGQRYEVDGQITVTISLNGAYTNPSVYYVSEQGNVTRMDSSVSGGKISFATTHNSYYVLAEQVTDSGSPGQTGDETESEKGTEATENTENTEKTEDTENIENTGNTGNTGNTSGGDSTDTGNGSKAGTSVKTGDETNLMFWLMLCGSSAVILAMLACIAIVREKQKRGRNR